MNRFLMFLPPILFSLLGAVFYFGLNRDDPNGMPSTFVGAPAPTLGVEPLANLPIFTAQDLASGQVVLVNFWASWCPPCRAENPTLLDLAAKGIKIYGVNMRDKPNDAMAFLAEDGNPFAAMIADPRGKMRLDWGVTAPPETFILRGDGTVAYRFIGPMVGSDYTQRFLPELEKAQQ